MKNTITTVNMGLLLILGGCGVRDTPHYKAPKTYGQIVESADEGEVGFGETSGESAEEIAQSETSAAPAVTATAPEIDLQPQPVIVVKEPAVTAVPVSEGSETSEEEELFIEPEASGPALVTSVFMRAGVVLPTLKLIKKGGLIDPYKKPTGAAIFRRPLELLQKQVTGFLNGREFNGDVKLWSKVYLDDINTGEGRVVQDGISSTGDLTVMFGGESESGQQILYRKNADENCPGAFICIDRIVWRPSSGSNATVCFVDPATDKPILFPYAPNPLYPAEQLQKIGGVYGAFKVLRLSGIQECNDRAAAKARHAQKMFVRVKTAVPSFVSLKMQKYGSFKPDIKITMDLDRYGKPAYGMNNKPFTDTLFKLQGHTEYSIDSEAQTFVKIIKRVRKDLAFPRGQKGTLGRLIDAYNKVNPIDGVMLDLQIEFCRDVLKNTPTICQTGSR